MMNVSTLTSMESMTGISVLTIAPPTTTAMGFTGAPTAPFR